MNHAQYAELFLTESREHITAVNHALLELERAASGGGEATGPAAVSAIGSIFRSVHTIKGMGATMGYAVVAELAHELENVLDRVRASELVVDAEVVAMLFRAADVLEDAVEAAVAGREGEVIATDLVGTLRALGAEPEQPKGGWSAHAPRGRGTLVRVRLAPGTPLRGVRAFIIVQTLGKLGEVTVVEPTIDRLQGDEFDNDFALRLVTTEPGDAIEGAVRSAGDVTDVQIGEDQSAAAPRERAKGNDARARTDASQRTLDHAAPTPVAQAWNTRARHVRIDVRRLDTLMNLVGELVVSRGRLAQLSSAIGDTALEDAVSQSSRLITELRDEITASRMVPVAQVFDRFPRLVRDAARSVGKQVELVVEGNEIELDRSMLDEVGDSLVHLLRNAIDHGIEPAAVRVAAGKPAAGRLTLSATRDRSAVVIKVCDDGKGIDRERVLAKAKRDGLVDDDRAQLTEDELFRLLARPGFSTAEQVTNLSGRGVGVDAVYTRVRALGGAMDIRSTPGEGTTIMLRLPLTLAIVRALLARVADEIYAVPLAHTSESIELSPDRVRTIQGREVLMSGEDVVPLLRLRTLVGLPPYVAPNAIDLEQAVVLDVGDRRAALVIDELTGQEEIVVKQFDAVRGGLPFFGGATLLGDGSPALIVDVSSLL